MSEDPPTPPLVLAARGRILSILDKRMASWEQFEADYPDHPGLDILLAELDYIRSVVNASNPRLSDNE